MLKVIVTGSTGLVGSRIIELLGKEFIFLPLLQTHIDITDKDDVWKTLKELEFDLFLHLAAYTNVDGAEQNRNLAFKVNKDGTKNIMDAVLYKRKRLIYTSTDFVFDGKNPPFYEDSLVNPISTYGESKLEGEKVLAGKAMIVRISYPYRKTFEIKKDFVRAVRTLLEQRKKLSMVSDSLITPTFIDDIAYALKHLMQNYTNEVFHINGGGALSPFAAGKMVARIFGLEEDLIMPVAYKEYFKKKALRPQLSDIRSKKNTFYRMKSFE